MQALNFSPEEIKKIHALYGTLNKENQRKLLQMNGLSRTSYYKYVKKLQLNANGNIAFKFYGMSFSEFCNYLDNAELHGKTMKGVITVEDNGEEKVWEGNCDTTRWNEIRALLVCNAMYNLDMNTKFTIKSIMM